MRISIIDLGFNSLKIVNYQVNDDKTFFPFYQKNNYLRLGEGLNGNGKLKQKYINKTISALRSYRKIIESQSIDTTLSYATSAVRDAKNQDDFVNQVFEKTKFRFKILSSEDEANISYLGALYSVNVANGLYFDIGGGSLELIYTENKKIKKMFFLPLGALKLSLKYLNPFTKYSITDTNYSKLYYEILNYLPKSEEIKLKKNSTLVGIGGTVRALLKYHNEINNINSYFNRHVNTLSYNAIKAINNKLLGMPLNEISKIKSIGEKRGRSIVAGSCVIELLMRKLNFASIVISNTGLREGILLNYLD